MENAKLRLGEKNRKGRAMKNMKGRTRKRGVQGCKFRGLRTGSIPNAIVSVWGILFCAHVYQ
jgi:hypothetical protein